MCSGRSVKNSALPTLVFGRPSTEAPGRRRGLPSYKTQPGHEGRKLEVEASLHFGGGRHGSQRTRGGHL